LIGARVLQGVGAALLLPGTLAVISRSYPGRTEQAHAIGIWAAVGSIALPAGPLLGGLLVQGLGWRWVFAINIPIVLVAWIVVAWRVPSDAPTNVTTGHERRQLDRAGTALAAVTLAALTLAVIQAGHVGLNPVAIGGAIVAVLAAVAFVRVERRAPDPMLPLELFRRPAFAAANAAAGAMNLGTLGLLFLLTLYLQTVQHRSALPAGVAVLPLFIPLTILAPIAGRAAGRYGSKPVMIIGLGLAACGVALLATWTAQTSYPLLLPVLLCWGVGLAMLTPAVVAAAIAAAPADRSGLASGVNNTARQAGGAIGIAIYGAIAGSPDDTASFMTGLHLTGVITAVLFAVAATATAVFIPRHDAR
jgi:MFS transporter, DHA2 family, methylenomycin A resistance protein